MPQGIYEVGGTAYYVGEDGRKVTEPGLMQYIGTVAEIGCIYAALDGVVYEATPSRGGFTLYAPAAEHVVFWTEGA